MGGKRVLVYSCRVCSGGDAKARPLGVLGVVFNWDGLAQKIMHETPIESDKKAATRVCIVDNECTVLADSHDRILEEKLDIPERPALFEKKKSCQSVKIKGASHLAARAQSPGFETYRTGWHSLIIDRQTG